MNRLTLTLQPELYNLLKERAVYNNRSANGECIHLIECALSAELEGNREILRTLMMAQGGVKYLRASPAPADPELERTATDGSSPSS